MTFKGVFMVLLAEIGSGEIFSDIEE